MRSWYSLGTDLTICLPEDHVWCGGSSRTTKGVPFIANIPTEEIFTAPLRDGIDGVVYASMPFVCGGTVVEDFHFVIRDGKIREVHDQKKKNFCPQGLRLAPGCRGRT